MIESRLFRKTELTNKSGGKNPSLCVVCNHLASDINGFLKSIPIASDRRIVKQLQIYNFKHQHIMRLYISRSKSAN